MQRKAANLRRSNAKSGPRIGDTIAAKNGALRRGTTILYNRSRFRMYHVRLYSSLAPTDDETALTDYSTGTLYLHHYSLPQLPKRASVLVWWHLYGTAENWLKAFLTFATTYTRNSLVPRRAMTNKWRDTVIIVVDRKRSGILQT